MVDQAEDAGSRFDPAPPPIVISIDPASAVWVTVGVLALFLLFALGRTSARALTLIGVGLLLAFAIEPVVKGVQHRLRCTRAMAVAVVGLLGFAAFALLAFIMGPPAAEQAQRFGRELPETVADLYTLPVIGDRLEEADASTKVEEWVDGLPGRVDADAIGRTAQAIFDGLSAGFVVLLVAAVVLLDGEVLVRRGRELVPHRHRARADKAGQVFYRVVGTYFAGSLFVACLGGVYTLAVGLALGVPLAPIAAIWYAVVSLIPQVGGFLGISFFTVLALSQGAFVALVALGLMVLYMNIENYVISPAIVGQSVNLSPPSTMIAALIGGAAIGVPGALAATPLCGTVKALYMEYRFGEELEPAKFAGASKRIQLPGFLKKLFRRE